MNRSVADGPSSLSQPPFGVSPAAQFPFFVAGQSRSVRHFCPFFVPPHQPVLHDFPGASHPSPVSAQFRSRTFPRIEILLYTMHDREEIILDVLKAGVRGFVLLRLCLDLLRQGGSQASVIFHEQNAMRCGHDVILGWH